METSGDCLGGDCGFRPSAARQYVEGQVWEYRVRAQDPGSLIKIQRIERFGPENVYHLSIIGVNFRAPGASGVVNHIPVSDETLDASVTRKAKRSADFSGAEVDAGIAEWRRANGGVFTITIAAIVNIVDDQISGPPQSSSI